MERLTIKYEGLFVPKKTCTIDRFGEADDCDSCDSVCESDCENCAVQECFTRLGEYEDTGLTPEQIRVLKERDMAKRCRQSIFDYDSITCVCGSDIDKDAEFMFCPWCGQKLKK